MIQLDKREAFPFSSNPFGLVYENAITENKENEVQIHPITYQLNGIKIASNIYTPKNYSKDKRYPAIVIAVPNGVQQFLCPSVLTGNPLCIFLSMGLLIHCVQHVLVFMQ